MGRGWPSLATQAIGERDLPAGSIREYRELEAGALAELRDVGPDLQAVRLAADVRGDRLTRSRIG